MIEMPESYVLVDQINKELTGKRIKKVEANRSPHTFAMYSGNPTEYNNKLTAKRILSADIYSGSVRIKAEDMILLITTPIRFHKQDGKLPLKHQLLIEFEDATFITCTIQMWGSLFCFKEGDSNGIPKEYKINSNPSPLEEAFNEEYYTALIQGEKLTSLSLKAFLTTEQRITGLGNGAAQDILFHAGFHPKRKMSTLQDTELNDLYKTMKRVLTEMYQKGGRDTEYDLYGNKGGYRTILSKNTVNQPCPVCHTLIKKESYLGGSIYICERCQS